MKIYILLLCFVAYAAHAQNYHKSSQHNTHTYDSSFYYYHLFYKLSESADSINAGKALLKVSPYLFMFDDVLPDSINYYLLTHSSIPRAEREKYTSLYKKVCASQRTPSYLTFQKMGLEDQATRRKQEDCKDSICHATAAKEMVHTDSIHAKFLNDYIHTKGWPTLEDGAMYATTLAMHDHKHHEKFIPVLRTAVLNGSVDEQVLKLIQYWSSMPVTANNLSKYLSIHPHRLFPANEILRGAMPVSLADIRAFAVTHCPFTYFYIYACTDLKSFDSVTNVMFSYNVKHLLTAIGAQFSMYNCNASSKTQDVMSHGIWSCVAKYSNRDTGLKICIIYKEKQWAFEDIVADGKFVTHEILFDVNKAIIKNESKSMLKGLATWLNKNMLVKLEICGHTDADGEATDNQSLSRLRAEAVKRQLVSYGVDSVRLKAVGYGETKPVRDNNTAEGKAENRRVEFIYVKRPAR